MEAESSCKFQHNPTPHNNNILSSEAISISDFTRIFFFQSKRDSHDTIYLPARLLGSAASAIQTPPLSDCVYLDLPTSNRIRFFIYIKPFTSMMWT